MSYFKGGCPKLGENEDDHCRNAAKVATVSVNLTGGAASSGAVDDGGAAGTEVSDFKGWWCLKGVEVPCCETAT